MHWLCIYLCLNGWGVSTDLINFELWTQRDHGDIPKRIHPHSDNSEVHKDLTGSLASQTHVNQLHLAEQTPNVASQVLINSEAPHIV